MQPLPDGRGSDSERWRLVMADPEANSNLNQWQVYFSS